MIILYNHTIPTVLLYRFHIPSTTHQFNIITHFINPSPPLFTVCFSGMLKIQLPLNGLFHFIHTTSIIHLLSSSLTSHLTSSLHLPSHLEPPSLHLPSRFLPHSTSHLTPFLPHSTSHLTSSLTPSLHLHLTPFSLFSLTSKTVSSMCRVAMTP